VGKEYSVTCVQEQGPRSYQEDRSFHKRIENPHCYGWFLAVMDGHEGSSVAELCAKEIGDLFTLRDADHVEEALLHLVLSLSTKTLCFNAGSTLSIACVLEDHNKVSVAVLGDSPVVVLDDKGHLHVSPEHNVRSNLKEREAAERRGGVYADGYLYKGNGDFGLQLSRALGDAYFEGIILREPEIYTIANPQWILVASDGLIDPVHSQSKVLFKKIAEYAQRHASAGDLMQWATSRGLNDNATALVWG